VPPLLLSIIMEQAKMVERKELRHFDIGLVMITATIACIGLAVIFSASKQHSEGIIFVRKQAIWAIFGVGAFILAAWFDHHSYPRIANRVYALNILLLIAVLLVGKETKGAQRWLGIGSFTIQPSEFAKVAIIITLAVFLAQNHDRLKETRTFILSLVHIGVPMLLIFKQPDLGTALVILAIWFGMAFVAGMKMRHLGGFVAVVFVAGLIAWNTPILKDYQKKRIEVLFNPSADSLGAGYHVKQAKIAIGSGQFTGKGWLKGTQSKLRFIPEQHTDFIFTVLGEEFGFVGTSVLLILFFVLLWKSIIIMEQTEDIVGRLIAAGIVSMFLFQITVNIGMTLGIMPVTGVPLPFVSYGGSSLLANMIAIGMLTGIGMRRFKISF